jgi:hypothetical protein
MPRVARVVHVQQSLVKKRSTSMEPALAETPFQTRITRRTRVAARKFVAQEGRKLQRSRSDVSLSRVFQDLVLAKMLLSTRKEIDKQSLLELEYIERWERLVGERKKN